MKLHDNRNVDEIVRLVIQRLSETGILRSTTSPIAAASQPNVSSEDTDPLKSSPLIVPGRVVSLSEIQDRLENVRSIQISASALLTPAVKDELRQRNISVVRSGERSAKDNAAPVNGPDGIRPRLRVFLPTNKPINWNVWKNGCQVVQVKLIDSARPVTDVAADTLGDWRETDRLIWSTPQPYAALVAASMHASTKELRALGLSAPGDLLQAVNEARPSVLILDDRRWTSHQIFNLSKNWLFVSQDHL